MAARRAQVVLAKGKRYEATATLGPRVLFQLSAEGKVVRGRPVRSWVSNYRWSLTETWLPVPPAPVAERAAEAALARGWLAGFGPGTLADLKWWTGWTVAQTRRALSAVDAAEVALDRDQTGFVRPDDVDPVSEPEPWVALLPALDPLVMGWDMPGRDWYLAESCRSALYDRSGNLGPTLRSWLGEVRVTTRFRTPLERELTA